MRKSRLTEVSSVLFDPAYSNCLIVTHVRPDGDAIGSLLALRLVLLSRGKRVVAFCEDPVPNNLGFLPGSDRIVHSVMDVSEFDVVVFVDCGAPDRAGRSITLEKLAGTLTVNIDHHVAENPFGDVYWVDREFSSTCEMLYEIFRQKGLEFTPDVATCLYTGILTDTGSFQFSNTTGRVLRIASSLVECGADPRAISENVFESATPQRLILLGKMLDTLRYHANYRIASARLTQAMLQETAATTMDSEGFVNMLRQVKTVRVGVLFREDQDRRIHVGLRSKGAVDVARFAKMFGGGGHVHAAACRLDGSIEDVEKLIIPALENYIMETEVQEGQVS